MSEIEKALGGVLGGQSGGLGGMLGGLSGGGAGGGMLGMLMPVVGGLLAGGGLQKIMSGLEHQGCGSAGKLLGREGREPAGQRTADEGGCWRRSGREIAEKLGVSHDQAAEVLAR